MNCSITKIIQFFRSKSGRKKYNHSYYFNNNNLKKSIYSPTLLRHSFSRDPRPLPKWPRFRVCSKHNDLLHYICDKEYFN